MPVRNLCKADIALVELLRGQRAAPRAVWRQLALRGLVKIQAGIPALTAKGRIRATRLKPAENVLRALFAGDRQFTTSASPSLKAIL